MATRLTKDQKRDIAGMAAVVAVKDLKRTYETAMDHPEWALKLPDWMFDKSVDVEGTYDNLMLGTLMVLEGYSLAGAIARLESEDLGYLLSPAQRVAINRLYRKEWINWFYRSVEKGEAWALFVYARLEAHSE